ncbi:hypothetical protein LZ30DRAFT_705305 [Colletotrichum cereale]|nr:hypothetical protein LZ30DRAFT_705305 [Colletotrichum cereale]
MCVPPPPSSPHHIPFRPLTLTLTLPPVQPTPGNLLQSLLHHHPPLPCTRGSQYHPRPVRTANQHWSVFSGTAGGRERASERVAFLRSCFFSARSCNMHSRQPLKTAGSCHITQRGRPIGPQERHTHINTHTQTHTHTRWAGGPRDFLASRPCIGRMATC